MRSLPQHRIAMVQSTVAYLVKNETVWQSHPAFAKAVGDLKKAFAASLSENPGWAGSPVSADGVKTHTREMLEDLTSEIADQLFALSQETGEVTLAAATDFSRASLDRLSDKELEHTALEICDLATKHRAALAAYLVVAADVAELETLTHHHVTGDANHLWDTQLQASLRAACRILRGRIDKMVMRYRLTDPDFVAGYQQARLLADAPRHAEAELMP